MPVIKESSDWKLYAGAAFLLGLFVAAYYFGWLEELSGWYNAMHGRP